MVTTDQQLAPIDAFSVILTEGPRELSPTRRLLREWLLAAGAAQEWVDEVLVAASEACTNALEHAYAQSLPGTVELRGAIVAGSLELVVSDCGVWKEPAERGNRGRGRNLMENLMDSAVIQSGPHGTTVRMQKELRLGA